MNDSTDSPSTAPERSNRCTAVVCMDGRIQDAAADFIRDHFDVDFVDTVTDAGPVGSLSGGNEAISASLLRCVGISVQVNRSVGIAVAGHEGCAGHRVEEEQHRRDTVAAAAAVAAAFPDLEVVPLFVYLSGDVAVLELAGSPS